MSVTDRLAALRIVDPVLTNLARGYSNNEMVAENLFPMVGNLDKEAGQFPQFSKEAFKLYQTERAIRALSNRMNPEGITPVKFVMEEHDLEYPIDYREDEEAIFPIQSHAVNVVTGAIQLRREKKAADLAQDASKYAVDNKIALAADDCFSEAGSDPIGVIEDGKEAVRQKIGKRPNTLVMGPSTRKILKVHPQLIERIKYSMKGIVTLDLMKEIFEVENIVCGEMIYSDDAGTFTDVWGDNIVLAYVPKVQQGQERTMYEPSYGYTLRKKDKPVVDKYVESGGKIQLIRNTDLFTVELVGAEAGYLISNTKK